MTQLLTRQKAIKLREQGKTYSEIKRKLDIPKSTLSDWLHNFPLTSDQFKELEKSIKYNKHVAIEKIRIAKQKKRDARLLGTYDDEKKRLLPLTLKQLEIAGLFLYWGEGNKNVRGPVSICNTDPQVIKFALYWLKYVLEVPAEKIKAYLHLYSDMNINKMHRFWSDELGVPLAQFSKPYIKLSRRKNIDQKGFGYGTCTLSVNDVRLKEKVILGIKAIADYYSGRSLPML